MFELLTNDREFADHNVRIMQQWLSVWIPQRHHRHAEAAAAVVAARGQAAAVRGLARPAKDRFSGILYDLSLDAPKELAQ